MSQLTDLPQSEAIVIASVVRSQGSAIDDYELSADDFLTNEAAWAYETAQKMLASGQQIDPYSIGIIDPRVEQYVWKVADLPTYAATFHADQVHKAGVRRRLDAAAIRLQANLNTMDVDDLIEQARADVDQAAGMRRQAVTYVGDLLDEVIDEAERERVVYPSPWIPLNDILGGGFRPGAMYTVGARPGIGKALALDTPIPTPTGWATMGSLKVGDLVYAGDGSATRVTFKSTIRDDRQSWRLTFSDGSTIVADEDHQWVVQSRASRRKGGGYEVRNTREIVEALRVGEGRANWAVPPAAVIADGRDVALPLDPWALGYWLGNGDAAGARVTAGGVDADHIRGEFVRRGLFVSAPHREERGDAVPFTFSTAPVRRGGAQRETAVSRLREIGVLRNKHIPRAYLRASVAQRRALLQGLMDSDGYVTKSGTAQFTVVDRFLAGDFRELARSLGMVTTWTESPCDGRDAAHSIAYTVTFRPVGQVATLPRKQERVRVGKPRMGGRRFITAAEPVDPVPTQCITVAHEDHTYLAGWGMVTTHNSAIALQMASAIAEHGPVAFSSLEMPAGELVRRIISQGAHVPHFLLERGQPIPEIHRRKIEQWKNIAPHAIAIDDRGTVTMSTVRAFARQVKRPSGRIAGLVVDYLQLMSGAPGMSRQEIVSENARHLKLLARDLECPVVALAQLNRNPEQRLDHRPGLSDLRDSGAIEQDSDVVMLLFRDPGFEQAPEGHPPLPVPLHLNVAKNRHGPTGETVLTWEGSQMRAY